MWNPADIAENVLLYLPLGLVAGGGVLRALLIGLALSTTAETVQLFSAGRFPGLLDIMANSAGAAAGSIIAAGLRRCGWDPQSVAVPKSAAWLLLGVGLLCGAALIPIPVPEDFANWDPSCRLLFGDELNGGRRWQGEIPEAAILAGPVSPGVIQKLVAGGPGSIERLSSELPRTYLIRIPAHLDTRLKPVQEPAAVSKQLFTEVQPRGQLSILLWIATADQRQQGPARIVTFSRDALHRNFTIGQEHRRIVFRLRTPATGENGADPEAETAPVLTTGRMTFIAATYDGRYSRIYVDGRLSADIDLVAHRVFGGIPALAFSAGAGALLFLAAVISGLFGPRQIRAAVATCAVGLLLSLSAPRSAVFSVPLRLFAVFTGGVVAARFSFRN